jgi:hypothetical protein
MNYSRYIYFETLIKESVRSIERLYAQSKQLLKLYLNDLQEEIRNKREQIYSRQEKSEWPVTSGDLVFIRYLDATEIIVSSLIMKRWLPKWTINNAISQLSKMLKTLETEHHPKIKVVFLAQETNIWPSLESVYHAFAGDSRCEAQLLYVPFEHRNNDKKIDSFTIYQNMGLPIKHCLDYNLADESPDIVFFSKPYDGIPMQFHIDNVDPVVQRSVYIPYWVNWMAVQNLQFLIDYHYRMSLHDKAWKIFDAPDYVRISHAQYGSRKGENLELIGHPRFDAIGKLRDIRKDIPVSWDEKIDNKMAILWNTHSYIKDDGWSTFATLGNQILEFFRTHQHFVLIWRPHPHFFNSLINGNVMAEEDVDALKTLVSSSNNIILDATPNYLYAFSVADALISDASSLLVEFLPTRKPILYTYNNSSRFIVNENLLPALYEASTWNDVEKFIQMLMDGKDHKAEERKKVVEKFMPNARKNVGELIMNKCIEDLVAEEIQSAKALSQKYRNLSKKTNQH